MLIFHALNRIRHLLKRRAIVLMYHRVGTLESDPWQLAVSESNFAEQLQVLHGYGRLVSVQELVKGIEEKAIPRSAICITFDDGYRDNNFAARPLLEKYNCPATFFIASGYVDQEQLFWWDELENIILHTHKLPAIFSLSINGQEFTYPLDNDSVLTENARHNHRSWVWPDKPSTKRCELYLAIWERLKPLRYDHLRSNMEKIRLWAATSESGSAENFPMKASEISDILEHPLFDIGIHTVTHPDLPSHESEIQRMEIADAKQFLETRFRRTMNTIAYPYGKYNQVTLNIVKELKLKAAFTTEDRLITNNDDRYRLGRFQVNNWNGEEFEKRLFKWMEKF